MVALSYRSGLGSIVQGVKVVFGIMDGIIWTGVIFYVWCPSSSNRLNNSFYFMFGGHETRYNNIL